MAKRLSKGQMIKQFPNQWLGIRNIEYFDERKREMKSAEVVYTDKTASELGVMALRGEDVQPFFTTPDDVFHLGFFGGV